MQAKISLAPKIFLAKLEFMKLAEHLKAARIKRGDFAAMIGVSPGWITQLCDGTGWPSREVAEKISRATNGAVTADDFLQLEAES